MLPRTDPSRLKHWPFFHPVPCFLCLFGQHSFRIPASYLFSFGAKPENTHMTLMPRARTKAGSKRVIAKRVVRSHFLISLSSAICLVSSCRPAARNALKSSSSDASGFFEISCFGERKLTLCFNALNVIYPRWINSNNSESDNPNERS